MYNLDLLGRRSPAPPTRKELPAQWDWNDPELCSAILFLEDHCDKCGMDEERREQYLEQYAKVIAEALRDDYKRRFIEGVRGV
jgi:hypothetical protein